MKGEEVPQLLTIQVLALRWGLLLFLKNAII
jgi:hypothetical protein